MKSNKLICEYCNKIFENRFALASHKGKCPIRRKKLNLPKYIPYNKGKTKENCVSLMHVSEKLKGKKCSKEFKTNLSNKLKGRKITWADKISETRKRKFKNGELVSLIKGKNKNNSEWIRKISESCIKTRNSKEYKDKYKKWINSLTKEERKKKWATYGNAGHKQSEESITKNKESNSITISNKILNNEFNLNGWAKHGSYQFKNNGKQHYDSTYELERMKWLDENGYIFKKNPFKIPYIYKNVKHHYIPDLLVVDKENANIYVEEIKSSYTLNNNIELNEIKFKAAKEYCAKLGFEFYVYNKDEYKVLDNIDFDEIESIEEVDEDDFYGFSNPIHKNIIIDDVIHHNSGKDTICCHCILYCVYILLCCKVPQNMFKGIDNKTVIDILNVASTAKQANSIFFTKMKNHVKSWKWLRNKYVIKDSGKKLQLDKKEDENIVSIKSDEILFPKNIRALSKHSQQEAAEGCSPLLWIADEFDSFSDKNQKSNAMAMYNALETSMRTRYGNQGKGFVISWPRYDGGPIQQLMELHKNDLRVYIDIASTFQVKPKRCFVDKWVNWKGYEIPEDYLTRFEKSPEDSKAKFLCLPPKTADPFFTEINRIDACVDKNKQPLFNYRERIIDSMNGKLISLELLSQNYNSPDISYVVAGDIGLSNDLTAVTIWHAETLNLANNTTLTTYIQDCLFKWKPEKLKGIKVDVDNIQVIIDSLIKDFKLPIQNIIFDHYNSATLLIHYSKRGINAQAYTLKTQDFYDIRAKIYDNQVRFLDDKYQNDEIKRLTNTTSGKPDHLPDEHDDVFRANCLAIIALSGFKNQNVIVNDDGIFFQKKMTPNMIESETDDFKPMVFKAKLHQGRNSGGIDFNPFDGNSDDYDDYSSEF